MKYSHKNIVLEYATTRSKLYIDDRLVFLGSGLIAIKMFIEQSGNNPAVIERFKAQLATKE
jgi:hypothetical protein|tara:strand:+ start:8878 stop:9060 length:183 start_codon:yes stop_codon:yes gene_type:complete